jgi:hypothetical protein
MRCGGPRAAVTDGRRSTLPEEEPEGQPRTPHAVCPDVDGTVEVQSLRRVAQPASLGPLELCRHGARIVDEREQQDEVFALRIGIAVNEERSRLDQDRPE